MSKQHQPLPSENLFQTFHRNLLEKGLVRSGWLGRVTHPNGKDHKITVKEVWELYKKDHLPTVTESTRVNKTLRCEKFLPPIFNLRMCELSPQLISEFIRFNLEAETLKASKKRFNFQKELKDFKSVARWYTDTIDFQYASPIKQHHYKLGAVC